MVQGIDHPDNNNLPTGRVREAANALDARPHPSGDSFCEKKMEPCIQLRRTLDADELMRTDHEAFMLLTQIAWRASRTDSKTLGLQPGQALIGDCRRSGFSARTYRTAKQHLAKYGFATFKTTSKGTIATLVGTSIYNINIDTADKQNDKQPTSERQAADKQPTTNKNVRREEGKKEEKSIVIFDHWNSYVGRTCYKGNQKITWHAHQKLSPEIEMAVKARLKDYSPEDLCAAIDNYATVLFLDGSYWTYTWSLYEFLTRRQGKLKDSPLQVCRFLPDNFHPDQFMEKNESAKTNEDGPLESQPTPQPALDLMDETYGPVKENQNS